MVTMLDYINEEEATLNRIVSGYSFEVEPTFKEVNHLLILATGSSYNACLAAKVAMEKIANITITLEEPYYFNHYGHLPETVDAVLAVSQSGKSKATIDAVANLDTTRIVTMVLTSDLASPITQVVNHVLDLGTGIETVGFVTKGYTATVLQLLLLSMSIGRGKNLLTDTRLSEYQIEIQKLIEAIPTIISKSIAFYENYESHFKLGNRFVAIGYGPNWGTAKEFETKFTETVRLPSQGFELEAYMHGPYLEANPNHILFFLETASPNLQRSEQLARYMSDYVGKVFRITTETIDERDCLSLGVDCNELFSPLALVIPCQIFAYKIATGKGIDLSQRIFDDFDDVLKSKV